MFLFRSDYRFSLSLSLSLSCYCHFCYDDKFRLFSLTLIFSVCPFYFFLGNYQISRNKKQEIVFSTCLEMPSLQQASDVWVMCVRWSTSVCSTKKKMQVKKENKNKREKERKEAKERKREQKRKKEKEKYGWTRTEREGKKIVSGRKYLADQLDYWYCCSIRDHLNANLSRNAS